MKRRQPENDLFEQLWLLRTCYPHRSAYDRASALTAGQAVVYGEELLQLGRFRARWTGRSTGFRTAHRTA